MPVLPEQFLEVLHMIASELKQINATLAKPAADAAIEVDFNRKLEERADRNCIERLRRGEP